MVLVQSCDVSLPVYCLPPSFPYMLWWFTDKWLKSSDVHNKAGKKNDIKEHSQQGLRYCAGSSGPLVIIWSVYLHNCLCRKAYVYLQSKLSSSWKETCHQLKFGVQSKKLEPLKSSQCVNQKPLALVPIILKRIS